MPIVLAIQNASVAALLGKFTVYWIIFQLVGGHFNATLLAPTMDFGHFEVFSNDTSADTTLFLVGFTNATRWLSWGRFVKPATEHLYPPASDDRYMLYWSITWLDLLGHCDTKREAMVVADGQTEGALTFNMQTTTGSQQQGETVHDVSEDLPECPELGGVVQIGPPPNATKPQCPGLEILESSRQ
ncbi:hypothetical protein N658DRAFT_259252 [Parathielavia hyrcaniae]|uniref:DUF7136 domain-containing protein n=1 Tax=Parathielavia hyrcaniae TaxID=113614 RepID=A0AAN6PU64_9PEZI|nr:hypothetical protein N658DRAFT_259252 [Parathielavia hyrcaniae]